MPRLLACLTLALALAPRSAAAQWASIGNMPRPTTAGSTVTFKNAQGVVAVTAVAPDIIRVRFAPGAALGRDHSYAVVGRDLGAPDAKIQVGADKTTLSTVASGRHDDASAVPHLGRRHIGRGDRRRRSAAWNGILRLRDACVEAAAPTTSRSTGSARRTATSTSGAVNSAATTSRCGTATRTRTRRTPIRSTRTCRSISC